MFSLKSSLKALVLLSVSMFFVGCGGTNAGKSAGGRSTAPSEAQTQKLNETKASAEEAENAYYEKKLERIELEKQMEDK
ncbi:MAG: hypothetical protein LBH98_06535 [Chitinispirillales bacterium]|jgi:hypothetical protein|nr:hypothetical protein [Chitinispirillales bacterium]